ncbi:MAG: bacillithiol biosynthesis deacetylase BshB1, partial [Planctomycetota bacterium]|nr:bacillithiol biosynthesis deacetylase BshB1 [Planctomycetota bacterium]
CTHLRHVPNPSFLIGIETTWERKREAILAYESQFVIPERNRRIVDWLEAAAVFHGSRIGRPMAEPFFTREPLGLGTLDSIVNID